jgi:predicted Fe-Mo cluster-binding NifX family protein
MKLIITAASPSIDAPVDPRFGRGAHFIIVDPDTMEWQAVPNPALNAHGGAGIRAAQFVTDHKCGAAISGDFGPNAFEALSAAGVSMYLFGSCHTVADTIQSYKSGQLVQLTSPTGTGQGHR